MDIYFNKITTQDNHLSERVVKKMVGVLKNLKQNEIYFINFASFCKLLKIGRYTCKSDWNKKKKNGLGALISETDIWNNEVDSNK